MKIYSSLALALFVLGLSLGIAPQVGAQDSIEEAPHFFHRDDGSVEAVWIAAGVKKSKTFKAGEKIRHRALNPWLGEIDTLKPHTLAPANLPLPKKVFVISDVEGQFETMRRVLRSNGVIDKKDRWSYGKGALVSVGDMVDRGPQVTEVLLMMWRLSFEAEKAGGNVHFVLGNHEAMCMGNDLRYVHPRYAGVCRLLGRPYDQVLAADTEIGRWLRSCPIVVKLGPWVFVHAGLAPEVKITNQNLDRFNADLQPFVGMTSVGVKKLNRGAYDLLWKSRGPLWYRGYFKRYTDEGGAANNKLFGPRPTAEQVDRTLARLEAKTIVIGHSKVKQFEDVYGKLRVLAIDIPWTKASRVRALWIEGDEHGWADYQGKRKVLSKPLIRKN